MKSVIERRAALEHRPVLPFLWTDHRGNTWLRCAGGAAGAVDVCVDGGGSFAVGDTTVPVTPSDEAWKTRLSPLMTVCLSN